MRLRLLLLLTFDLLFLMSQGARGLPGIPGDVVSTRSTWIHFLLLHVDFIIEG